MLSARGTQLYAAPELRFGLEWNERIDVWACGLCIFFMTRSQQPFSSENRQNARLLQQGRLPTVDWGAMSKPLVNLVRQCLVVQMRDRPSPPELLEHCVFFESERITGGTMAEGTFTSGGANPAIRRCPAVASLPSCGLIMREFNNSPCSTQLDRQQPAVRDLALRRYLRLEGGVPSSAKAWTSPL